MSKTTTITITCDRCKTSIDADDAARGEWARIAAGSIGKDRGIGDGPSGPDDLCPDCLTDLFRWFSNAAAAPPAVATMPPPPLLAVQGPRRLGLRQRRAALEAAIDALKAQVTASFDVLREQPTVILSGEIIPAAYASTDQRAASLVSQLFSIFSTDAPTAATAGASLQQQETTSHA